MKISPYLLFLFMLCTAISQAQLSEKQIDDLVKNTLTTFEVPGISVGIVKDGKVVYAKGHGLRSLQSKLPMNEKTLVGVASNSKGFTAFALAMLVEDGLVKWDDKVRDHLPEFRLQDAYATENMRIKDLLTHNSGLGLGAGDLMFFPEGNDFSAQEIVTNLKHITPTSSLRSEFAYNNNMYIVAGEVIERLSGLSWEEFIEQRIMQPVGMKNSKAAYNRVSNKSNIIAAHTRTEGKVIQIPHDWSETANPAGGIMSNIPDMLTWAQFLMNNAQTKNGIQLLPTKQLHQLWQLQTPLPVSPKNDYNTHFFGYALGWFVKDVAGYKEVTHTGGLLGTVTQFTLIPELDLGIVVLTNQMNGNAFKTITNTIKDSYLGYKNRDWLSRYDKQNQDWLAKNDSIKQAVYHQVDLAKENPQIITPKQIIGEYKDNWMGTFKIYQDKGKLRIASFRSSQLVGDLLPYNATTYVAKWDNRSFDADVFVIFSLDENAIAQQARMQYIAPITDFSFDFGDLKLKRIKD